MRYTRVGVASYAIASVLAVAVVGVAWARSQTATSASTEAEPPAEVATLGGARSGDATPYPQEAGAAAYEAECAGCHRAGEARGRNIPALRGHVVSLFTSAGGREYLVDLMLDGVVRFEEGGRTVLEETHPDYEQLSDETVAAILNHMLVSWGNEELLPEGTRLYTAAEVAARRAGA